MIAHVPDQPLMVLGAFTTGGPNQQIIEECDNAGVNMQAAIGHSGRVGATSTTFSWRAPSDADGMVDFRYHVKILSIIKSCRQPLCLIQLPGVVSIAMAHGASLY